MAAKSSAESGPSASFPEPKTVEPIKLGNLVVEVERPGSSTLVVRQQDREVWRVAIEDRHQDPKAPTVMPSFVARLEKGDTDESVKIGDDFGVEYSLDIKTRKVRISKWPVQVRLLEWSLDDSKTFRYTVELEIRNFLTRPLSIDPFLIGGSRQMANDPFRVSVDGQPISFVGPEVKRAKLKASEMIVLKPGEQRKVEIDLTKVYPITKRAVGFELEIGFAAPNHFSTDDFLLTSPSPARYTVAENSKNFRQGAKPKPGS